MSSKPLDQAVSELVPQLLSWRRDLHRHPELGFDVERTAGVVESTLRDLGIEVRTGVGRSGVVGLLRAPESRGPAVLLRADMDALPIQEVEGREYGSTVPGRMHACGHDGHTSMLLGAATLLSAERERLTRDVVLCFQPAEEGGAGAHVMIEDGLLETAEIGAAYGLHLWSQYPVGTVHVRPGPAMAGSDEFTARIIGRGGHGAEPDRAVDPIVAAAQAVTMLQTVVSRSVAPIEPAVVTVGRFEAGRAPNVIPDHAEIEGTLRAFSHEVRQALRTRLREVLEGAAAAHGARVELELREGYPPVINDAAAVERVREVARDVVGESKLHEPPAIAASEDFSYYLEKLPGAFVFVGAGNEARGITAAHHSPRFDIDEDALPVGTRLLAELALRP
jgi:amidohydrolase